MQKVSTSRRISLHPKKTSWEWEQKRGGGEGMPLSPPNGSSLENMLEFEYL